MFLTSVSDTYKILQANWRVFYFNDIELYGCDFTRYCQRELLFTAPVALPLMYRYIKYFITLHRNHALYYPFKDKFGFDLFCFKSVNIIPPLVMSNDLLLTENMSNTNISTCIYTLDIYNLEREGVIFL